MNRFGRLAWGVAGGLFVLPWAIALYSGDQISAWWGESLSDSVKSSSSTERYPASLLGDSQAPVDSLLPIRRSPSWLATVRDPLENSKRLIVWMAEGPSSCIELKLIDEKSTTELSFTCGTQWSWKSAAGGPMLRIPLQGGPYSQTYKEILLKLPQLRTIEGELHWVSHEDQALVSRFAWVASPSKDSSFLARGRMARAIRSN